ncbi:MAG: hypothetical protein PHQ54_02255 [Candidatus Omnitrophica bacterium]|nr:hypothetical protein [Candidatus Omnitrophota bacterium]
MRKLGISVSVLLIFSSCVFAQDVEQTVLAQIEYTKQRMAEHRKELSDTLAQFAKNPTPELYSRINKLQSNVAKENNILSSLGVALRDARAAKSWWALVEDMGKESTLISAGASVVSSVYDAGKWIFGPTQEDIFGESWQEAEALHAKMVNEARKIREESRAIAAGLVQIDSIISSGSGTEALNNLRDDMVKKLKALEARKELVRKNLKFLVRLYRAEKENLPAATIFWGEDHMGRYVEAMVNQIGVGNLIDHAMDLLSGNMVKPLVEFIKPMVKVAIGDYLAKARGGDNLTPQIIDDLTFSILFGSDEKNLEKFFYSKLESEVTGKVLEKTAQGMIEAEAQLLYRAAHKKTWDIAKQEIANLPLDLDFTDKSATVVKGTEKLVKQTEESIRNNAMNKLDKAVKAGKVIKDLWDVVFKDAIQVYLVSDTFTATIKSANEACAGYRKQWQEMKDDMILTENEYVNNKWFSEKSSVSVQPPKGAVDSLGQKRQEMAAVDPKASAKVYDSLEKAVQTYGGTKEEPAADPGNMDLTEIGRIEEDMFRAVLEGKMPADKIMLPNVYNLTAKKMHTPCYEETARLAAAFAKSWPEEKCMFREEIAACNASAECRAQNRADPGRWWRKRDQCRADRAKSYEQQVSKPSQECTNRVYSAYRQYVDNRARNILKFYNMIEKKNEDILSQAKEIAGPAISWMQSYESESEKLNELAENKELHQANISNLNDLVPPPDLPKSIGLGGNQVSAQDYNLTKVKNVLSDVNKVLKILAGADFDNIGRPLEKVDFSIDEINGFFNENPWLKIYDSRGMPVKAPVVYKAAKASEAVEKNYFYSGPGAYSPIGAPNSLVTLSEPKEVISQEEQELFLKVLHRSNPKVYQWNLDRLLAMPVVANRDSYLSLVDFSPDKAYSLYKEALTAYNNAVNQGNIVSKLFAEAEQIYRQRNAIQGIVGFYSGTFKQWAILRKPNPSAAANILNKDTEEFEKIVADFEKQIEVARAQIILPDVDNIRREIDKFTSYAKNYQKEFNAYYAYLAEYFKDRNYDLFETPDVLHHKMRADRIQIFSDQYSADFKQAADGLKEMKAAVPELKEADKRYIIAISEASSQKARLVDEFKTFYRANPDKPQESLKKLQQAREAVQQVAMPNFSQNDHHLPKNIKEHALKIMSTNHTGGLDLIEQELQKKKAKEDTRKVFTDYWVQNATLNMRSLSGASGEVVLLKNDLKQGVIEIQGWFSNIDMVEKVFFSADGTANWQELPKDLMFTASFTPLPQKLYQPLIKVKTEDSQEFQIKVFPNISGIIVRQEDYNQLVAQTLKKIADAYEAKDINGFSEHISRGYLGNKTFLEEGARFDFEVFSDIRLAIYINRIEKRSDLFIAETKWDKTQILQRTGQQQKTSGNTTFIFSFEEGAMKIKNLRGSLIYATLSPEIAQASGLPSAAVEEIRIARDNPNSIQTATGSVKSGAIGALTVHSSPNINVTGWPGIGFDFTANSAVDSGSSNSDINFEGNMVFADNIQSISEKNFNSITEALESGYTSGGIMNDGPGSVYMFITKEGYYGKMEITNVTVLSEELTSVTLKFSVQSDGSRNLATK